MGIPKCRKDRAVRDFWRMAETASPEQLPETLVFNDSFLAKSEEDKERKTTNGSNVPCHQQPGPVIFGNQDSGELRDAGEVRVNISPVIPWSEVTVR